MGKGARQLKAIMRLPAVAVLLIPLVLLWCASLFRMDWARVYRANLLSSAIGAGLVALGMIAFVSSVRLFAVSGQGTLAPWDPPRMLITKGLYRKTRNPMITGVLFILIGEALIFGSILLGIWSGIFLLGNHVYIVKFEEPALFRRFGGPYREYMQTVPRWIPRFSRSTPGRDG